MPVEMRERIATIVGALSIEDVTALVGWLRVTDNAEVDLAACTHLHTAGFQALLVFAPTIVAGPRDPFLATHLFGTRSTAIIAAR
jgi:hypothetical protein